MIDLRVDQALREDPLLFHAEDMTIDSVLLGILTDANAQPVDYDYDDGILEVSTDSRFGATYVVIIEYSAPIRNDGTGIFRADFNNQQYLGMNLYPTHARRVFPCLDELTSQAPVMFNFMNVDFPNMVSNSVLENDSTSQFRSLAIRLHLWGMLAHNFQTVMIPQNNVVLRGRTGLNQEAQAIAAIQSFFNDLNEWTNKDYFSIIVDQNGQMNIFALPDTNVDWSALSTVCIWEPYVFMEQIHSAAQQKTGLVKIAEAMARQWFGFVTYPQNWRHEWVVTGLRTHAAYDVVKKFQTDPNGLDASLLDMNTIFITDVVQESLLRDAYTNAEPLLPAEDMEDEERIRSYINGLIKYKAPSILWMLRVLLGDENDYIQMAADVILNTLSLDPISSLDFISSIESVWLSNEANSLIGNDLDDFLDPWINTRGYPVVSVGLRQGGVWITPQHFGFNNSAALTTQFNIPLSYTSSKDMNFDNIRPVITLENTMILPMDLSGDSDFILFNIQGQGYYRVEYDADLMERIIECLEDPDCRNSIHPLNRATLVDDFLNFARAGRLDYDWALKLVLTMEHETEYAPWKAFIRNMDFIRKRLQALIEDDDDLDQEIYTRMIRRTITAVENELSFFPDPALIEPAMASLTRGMVMDHACRSGYAPCIAAAIDWFYDPNSPEPQVNPDIPKDIRPAVYCAMVREGGGDAINALYDRLEVEPSHWERIVILESLACSQDNSFINSLLLETIADNSPYGVEERSKIFAAVASSSQNNLILAINFARMRTNDIRNRYGGPQKLEELLYIIADNANADATGDLESWIDSVNSDLDDSLDLAKTFLAMANENVVWEQAYLMPVYEWIDENDAPKIVLSMGLVFVTLIVTLFNH
ncbi:membrane alanyl aminopeptidase [Phthorimaea operculella]|nr:membrane alanyl aminopeptidase [Phthorimaea operculella]